MYEIIEKNKYGVLVRDEKDQFEYYLSALEAEKLETELTPETFTINDLYVESKLLFDCQDKLNDLQIENDQLKERIENIDKYLDEAICLSKEKSDYFKSIAMEMSAEGSGAMKIAYQNVKEFIKNQK